MTAESQGILMRTVGNGDFSNIEFQLLHLSARDLFREHYPQKVLKLRERVAAKATYRRRFDRFIAVFTIPDG